MVKIILKKHFPNKKVKTKFTRVNKLLYLHQKSVLFQTYNGH